MVRYPCSIGIDLLLSRIDTPSQSVLREELVDPSDPNYYWLTDPDQFARFGSSLLKTDLMLVILLVRAKIIFCNSSNGSIILMVVIYRPSEISQVTVTNLSSAGINITFITDQPTLAIIQYGTLISN